MSAPPPEFRRLLACLAVGVLGVLALCCGLPEVALPLAVGSLAGVVVCVVGNL